MPIPAKFRLTLTIDYKTEPRDFPKSESFEFEAFPTASCTLAQHFAAKAWYALQASLESKEPTS
jgi:hypothetical protein